MPLFKKFYAEYALGIVLEIPKTVKYFGAESPKDGRVCRVMSWFNRKFRHYDIGSGDNRKRFEWDESFIIVKMSSSRSKLKRMLEEEGAAKFIPEDCEPYMDSFLSGPFVYGVNRLYEATV